jgi:hypothetical protein
MSIIFRDRTNRKREKERLFINFSLPRSARKKNYSTDVSALIVNRTCKNALSTGFASRIGTRVASAFDELVRRNPMPAFLVGIGFMIGRAMRASAMATEVQNTNEQSTPAFVAGIIDDVHRIMKQQLELTRQEIAEDFRKAKEATWLYTAGVGIAFFSGIALCFALVHLVHWWASPPGADPAWLPLWGCHAAIGLVLGVIAGTLLWAGEQKRQSINPLHSTASEALKENVEWATHPARPRH